MTVYRLTMQGHIGSAEIWDTTLHVNDAPGAAAGILATFATATTNLWTNPAAPADSIQQYISTLVGVDGLIVDELNSIGRNVAQARGTLAIAGTSVDESLPPGVAVCCSTRTAMPTRQGRGRSYLPPYVVSTVNTFRLDSTVRDHTAAAFAKYIQTIKDGTLNGPIVWSKNTGDQTFFITSVDVGDVFDSMRTRRDKTKAARPTIKVGRAAT